MSFFDDKLLNFIMKNISFLILISFLVMATGCRTVSVTVLEDDNRNFRLANYATYDFYQTEATGQFNQSEQIYFNQIKEEVAAHMDQRGVARDTVNPELKINIGIHVEERTQTRETGLVTDPGTFTYIGQRRYTWRSETVEVGRYRKGTGTIHFVDAERQSAVWVGVVEEILSPRTDRIERTIRDGVREVFNKIDEYN